MYGHDHCQMHVDEGRGPVYVLSGAGFECCYPGSNADKIPKGAQKMAYWLGDCPPVSTTRIGARPHAGPARNLRSMGCSGVDTSQSRGVRRYPPCCL